MTHQQLLADYIMFFFIYRPEPSGNCRYSPVLLALVGDNSLIEELRVLTSILLSSRQILHFTLLYLPNLINTEIKFAVGSTISHLFTGLLKELTLIHVHGDQLVEMEVISNCENKKLV